MPFDDDRVYRTGELEIDALPDVYQRALSEIEQAQRALVDGGGKGGAGVPSWEKVDGVRQMSCGDVVFLPDEKDVPSPPGTALGKVGCFVFIAAGCGLVQMLFSSHVPVRLTLLVAGIVIASVALMVGAKRSADVAETPILRTGHYLFPDVLLFVRTTDVQVFPKKHILDFRIVPWSRSSTLTSVTVRGADGEEERNLVGSSGFCPRLQRWLGAT
jgi:hypothetical protein